MKINIECIPCYFKQALQAAQFATDDPALWWDTMHNVAAYVQTLGPGLSSHDVAENVHRIIRQSTKCADPYRDVKRKFNELALSMLDDARGRVQDAPDPLEAAVRMSIAGNVIDFGSEVFLDLDSTILKIMDVPFAIDHRTDFFEKVKTAQNVLVLGDNTGEIVFDRLLLEQLAPRRITFSVRGAPILNDATPSDARQAGVHELADIIDTGAPIPGVPLERMPDEFLKAFHAADIIISKGQANFESLCDKKLDNLFFLFTIKCKLVGRRTGTSIGDIVLIQSSRLELRDV